jgi:prevent-host-death family protein
MQTWQIQTAKAKFSDLVKRAGDDGPQEITVHGHPVAVVVSAALFNKLTGNQASLVDFMARSPLFGQDDVVFERDPSPGRDVDLGSGQ